MEEKYAGLDVEDFLKCCHDLPDAKKYIKEDSRLKAMLNRVSVDKYVFTASPCEHAQRCMDLMGISSCFKHPIIDVRAVGFYTKHNAECYQRAMAIAGVAPENARRCLFLDDSVSNIKAAKAIGWRTVLVGRFAREDGSELVCPEADHIVGDIYEVEALYPQLFRAS